MKSIRRLIATLSMVAFCTLTTQALHASTTNVLKPVQALFAKSKTVQLSLRNDSGASIELRAGDQVMQIDPGKTISVKLPSGTRIVTNTETAKHKLGELIVEVSSEVSGATIAII